MTKDLNFKKYIVIFGFFSEWNVGGFREGEIYFRDSDWSFLSAHSGFSDLEYNIYFWNTLTIKLLNMVKFGPRIDMDQSLTF